MGKQDSQQLFCGPAERSAEGRPDPMRGGSCGRLFFRFKIRAQLLEFIAF
jgi:hypothetical protein